MTPSLAHDARKRIGRVRRLVGSLSLRELLEVLRVNLESANVLRSRVRAAVAHPEARVVFICHGNIMRSAFAEAYIRSMHPNFRREILSSGTHASLGSEADADAVTVAAEFGVDLTHHRSTPLRGLAVRAHDVLICMDLHNAAMARAAPHVAGEQVFLVGDVFRAGSEQAVSAGQSSEIPRRIIPDPYGLGVEATRRAFVRVQRASEAWVRLMSGSQ